jgi:hypothetical protein
MSQTLIHRTPGVILVIFASFASGLYLWLARSVLVPISDRNGTEYVFVSAPVWTLTALALAALVVVLATHVLVRHLGAAPQPPLFTYADVSYLSPLLALAVSTLALLNLKPWFSNLPPLSYAIVDLRWWWTALLLFWFASHVDRRLQGALWGWARQIQMPAAVRRWAPEVTLVALALTAVIIGTPILRFSGATIGDESRYLRYCENWYQGLGFEVTHIQPIGDLPADFRPQVWQNFTLLAQVLPGELQSLASDTAAFLNEPSRRFNQAQGEGRFFTGKNGGVYQVHQPGISFLMFPAYYLDRQFGGPGRRANSQWPASLIAVNTFFLSLYALWTVLTFRFLRRTVETTWVPWVTTLAVALTMPLAAFPFQFYPELAAGVMLFAVAGHLLFATRATLVSSFLYGVLAGYLPWLHVRFSVVAAVLAAAAAILLYRQKPRLAAFLAGFALPVACLALYAYRLTGSVLPTAMWPEDEGGVLSLNAMSRFSVSYLIDRNWGLFAYSPVYLLALPGCWWLARRRPDIFWLAAMLFLALLLPASAHSLGGGGTTPMRLILAVIPFAVLPLVELLARYRDSRLLKVIFGLLLVVSVENAFAYNLHHSKDRFQFIGPSFSGWKVNLLFPADAAAFQFASADGALLAGWLIALVALPLLPLLVRRARMWAGEHPIHVRSTATLALATTILAVLVATAVSAATGLRRHPRFQISAQAAHEAIADRIRENGGCAICVSSTRGRVDLKP